MMQEQTVNGKRSARSNSAAKWAWTKTETTQLLSTVIYFFKRIINGERKRPKTRFQEHNGESRICFHSCEVFTGRGVI